MNVTHCIINTGHDLTMCIMQTSIEESKMDLSF